jgi:hypothetical protein
VIPICGAWGVRSDLQYARDGSRCYLLTATL